jgi:hypothetical protein
MLVEIMLTPLLSAASAITTGAYRVKNFYDTAQMITGNVKSGYDVVASSGGGAVMLAATTFVSYFGIEAYRSISSAIYHGLDNHTRSAAGNIGAVLAHSIPPQRNSYDNNARARVFVAGIVSIIFQWIQHQGATAMRDSTIRESARRKTAENMLDYDKRRIDQHGGDGGRPMMFYDTYRNHRYYTGDASYMDFSAGSLDISSLILRPIVNVLVGVSVQVENIFFQTGNFDHLHFLNNVFQSIGLYEIIVYALRKHEWSLIQSALMMVLKPPKQINARRRR